MSETAQEKADRAVADVQCPIMHPARARGIASIRDTFQRAEEAEVLDKALTVMIVRAQEAGDCPHVISLGDECPHDSMGQPEDSVCQECFRDWALAQAKEAEPDGQ